ncbi:glycosyltransferase family 2 protein [Pseudohoeflea suaedae]|uniref:glycosyltransferase family 2 protein n=1 Tax=Pseudohoeflea suaedae TaxID=877384 RepID=UPI001304E725|nr:glycosyltransferase family 2 protein [Pseudohoeflea suaedae]
MTHSGAFIPVSVFIICFNEERVIEASLRALSRFQEILVVDSGSTDRTVDIVEGLSRDGLPVRLIHHDWTGFGAQKQFALEQCSLEWAFNVDADEIAEPTLVDAIAKNVASPGENAGFSVERRHWVPGYGYAHPWVKHDRIVRLVRRAKSYYDTKQTIHESLRVDGATGRVAGGYLLHASIIAPALEFEKQNSYTSLKASERSARGRRTSPSKMLTAPIGYFVKFYLLKRYFLCGWGGFAMAAGAASYAYQTEYKSWRAGLDPR